MQAIETFVLRAISVVFFTVLELAACATVVLLFAVATGYWTGVLR